MPAGSKMDPPLAKAKPISASVITFKKENKRVKGKLLQPERGARRCKKLCRHQGTWHTVFRLNNRKLNRNKSLSIAAEFV
ncbi:zinc finger protein 462-like [Grus japonensis]|uniref:Zinc finger protein 462-like n=1 Tax=Grus japonensis TaxID=30415 RepID=A0ABC9W5Q0_GRUJA